ncbi:hypothetical protein ACEPPN_009426 [Leptodophora sp. 'Broadleaf-Isolate-01']
MHAPLAKEARAQSAPAYTASASSSQAIPQELFRRLQQSPPTQPPQPIPSQSPTRIVASSTPQWTWTNAHCKAWLYEVCITLLNYSVERALALCWKFLGFGPTLYAMDRSEWEALLGRYDGMGVYSLLLGVRHQAGAAPDDVVRASRDGHANGKEEKSAKRMSRRRKH